MTIDFKETSKKVETNTFKMLQPSGKFIYQIDVSTGKPIKNEYNLLRHFGTLWYLGRGSDNARRAYTMKGLKWAYDKYWYRSKHITGAAYQYKGEIKTGGVALAILAKIALNDLKDTDKLSDFLLSMQKEDGDFIHKLDINLKDSGFLSEYYTGEILFALASLEAISPDKKRMKAIMKCMEKLLSTGYGIAEQSHWMMHALNATYAINHNPMYVSHSCAIVHHIIKHTEFQNRGCNPIGCRIEGLLANAKILKQESPQSDTFKVRFSIIERNIDLMLAHLKDGYFHKNNIVQIDNQQHCGDALRTYISLSE